MRYKDGEPVTIVPADDDPELWRLQRHVTVDHLGNDGYHLPHVQGPVPEDQLIPGWVSR